MSVATKTWPLTFVPLVRMALVGALAYEFQVVLPLLVRVSLHGGAGIYGFLTSAMGAGAVAGGLVLGGRARTGLLTFTVAAVGFGVAIVIYLRWVRTCELASGPIVNGCGGWSSAATDRRQRGGSFPQQAPPAGPKVPPARALGL